MAGIESMLKGIHEDVGCLIKLEKLSSLILDQEKQKTARQTVQIINPTKTTCSDKFVVALKQKMSYVDFKYPMKSDALDDNMPLIVVCQSMSRLKTDVEYAINSVQRSSAYVVIYLIIGSERNLPSRQTEQKLGKYENITFVDMGYNEEGGIFECQQNIGAEVQLRSYIGCGTSTSPNGASSSALRCNQATQLLLDTPWRPLNESGIDLQKSIMKDIEKENIKQTIDILCIGPEGSGKSHFINSCLYVVQDMTAAATTGCSESSPSMQGRCEFSDILPNVRRFRCIEPNEKIRVQEITCSKKGTVESNNQVCRSKSEIEGEAHCVVYVVDAIEMHAYNILEYFKVLLDTIQPNKGIQRVVILTKADLLCNTICDDALNMFRSSKLEKAVKMVSEVFAIGMASIHPVINYKDDRNLSTDKNIPILLALRQILQYACDRVENDGNDMESESDEDD